MSVIKGSNVFLYFKVDGFFKPIACCVSCNVTTNTELSETSTVQTGTSRTYRGNRNSWRVSCQGLVSFDTNHPHVKLRQLQHDFTIVPIAFTATDDNGLTSTFSGNVLITSMPDDAASNDFYTYAIEATGTGDYTITDIPIDPNECCQDAWIYHNGTGSEGTSITLPNLAGKQIAGRLYRDGIEYRPSGVDHDGLGAPIGKQFKFEPAIGKISFDPALIAIASGEPIDIPYNLCGSSTACNIIITNVIPFVDEADSNKFHITFQPTLNGVLTAPDDVKVRYSIDGGTTWVVASSITYDPNTNYQLVVVNVSLPKNEPYLFEVTPICNGVPGTSGTGYWIEETCRDVTNLNAVINGADIDYSFTASADPVSNYTVNLVNSSDTIVDTQTITGTSGTFASVPDIDTETYRVFVYSNCVNDMQSGGIFVTVIIFNINWNYSNDVGIGGHFRILVNSVLTVDRTVSDSGGLLVNIGDLIDVIVQTTVDGIAHINITGPYTNSTTDIHINTDAFTVVAGAYIIGGISGS